MTQTERNKPYLNHLVAELEEVEDVGHLNDPVRLQQTFLDIAAQMQMTVVEAPKPRHFEPHGVTFMLMLSESHLAVHTWPEIAYMHVDALVCSRDVRLFDLGELLQRTFNPVRTTYGLVDYHARSKTVTGRLPAAGTSLSTP